MGEKRIWELLSRHFNNEISEAERKELQQLVQESGNEGLSPELLLELHLLNLKPAPEEETRRKNSLEAIQKAIRLHKETADQEPAYDYEPAPLPLKRGKRRLLTLLSAAACFIILLAGYYFTKRSSGTARPPEQYETIATRAGSKTVINLPDSSTVLLNSACKISYNRTFGSEGRDIELTGEAYFDIRKSAEAPLVVHAGNVIIRVLGTTFDVRANPEDSFVEATLIRGSIEVSLKTDPERKILLRPNEKIVIRKNDDGPIDRSKDPQGRNKDAMIAVTKVAPDPGDSSCLETIWTKTKLPFHKEHFTSLARKMERWYNVRFLFTDTSLNEMVFTGSLEKESLSEALNALQHVAHFNYNIDGQTVTISK